MKKFLFFFTVSFFVWQLSAELPYPEIKNLQNDDIFFNQYSVAVLRARKAIASIDSQVDISPEFYTYVVKPNESLISIAARCCIPYDAIATINHIASAEEDLEGKRIILPSLPALYVYPNAQNTIEMLLNSYIRQAATDFEGFEIVLFTDQHTVSPVYCVPNALFNGTIRAFFFLPYYQFPLENYRITSRFGLRKDPFTGRDVRHSGIDIAASYGAPVHSISSGVVSYVGFDTVLGKHIIILQRDGRESVYGHLSAYFVNKGDKVKTGMTIGAVGSTGRSTGNHLHLEIREQSMPTDPAKFFKN